MNLELEVLERMAARADLADILGLDEDVADDDDGAELRDRWTRGDCVCACSTRRGADGKLQSTGACTCERLVAVRDHGHGPRLIHEPCAGPAVHTDASTPSPTRSTKQETTMSTEHRHDDSTDAEDPIARAYANQKAWSDRVGRMTDADRAAPETRIDVVEAVDDDPIARARANRDAWATAASTKGV